MAGSPDATAAVGKSPLRPIERVASFRFAYLAIFVFLVAYVFTVEGLEEVFRRHYQSAVEAAVRVDPANGPVAGQISSRLKALLQAHPGGSPLRLHIELPGGGQVTIAPAPSLSVAVDDTLRQELEEAFGRGCLRMH